MARKLRSCIALGSLLISSVLFVSPAVGQVNFVCLPNNTTGSNPQSVAVGDVNGDGGQDVVAANYSSNTVSVFLNALGTGQLKAPVAYATGTGPSSLAIADVDNDGKQDLIVANMTAGSVSVLLGNGDGTFKAASSYSVLPAGTTGTPSPSSVTAGDVDNDGKVDLVVANSALSTVSILRGDGKGGFTATASVAVGRAPGTVALARFTSGNNLDIVTSNKNGQSVSIALGNGNGTFQAAKSFSAGPVPQSLVARDVDGDGKTDVVVCNNVSSSGIRLMKGNGDGTLQTAVFFAGAMSPINLCVGDFNKDGRPDVATSNVGSEDVGIYLNTGGGTFAAPITVASGATHLALVSTDIDGDNNDDIIVSNTPNSMTVLLNVTANISNLLVSPNTVLTGNSTKATVKLNRVAPAGGALVSFTSSDPTLAWVPDSSLIPAGSDTATVYISTTSPNSGTVTITASYNGVQMTAPLTINPLPTTALKSDVTGDGKVDIQDIVAIARIVGGLDPMK